MECDWKGHVSTPWSFFKGWDYLLFLFHSPSFCLGCDGWSSSSTLNTMRFRNGRVGEVREVGSLMVLWSSFVMTVLGCLHENTELSILCKYSVLQFLQLYAILQCTWANTKVLDFNKWSVNGKRLKVETLESKVGMCPMYVHLLPVFPSVIGWAYGICLNAS